MTFSDLPLSDALRAPVHRMGFSRPTAIQAAAIPPAAAGRDILASAETGSGKTAAFLLPIINRLLPQQRGATRALVLAPTRELAAQIADHFTQLAHGTRLTSAAVFGGVSMGGQDRAFKKGVDLIVACPGRLLDHMRGPHVDFSSLQCLVLDEADRMLDMGFLPDIKRVLAALPKQRQTLLFSATLPPAIVELSRGLLVDPVRIDVERRPAPASGVSHAVYPVSSGGKPGLLVQLLGREIRGTTLVFTRTKHRANRVADLLDKHGVPCARIHGNRSQSQRTAALAGFKSGEFRVLVATDIASRGIDVEALGSVVNFDVPHVAEDYVHRVGRTARAQLTGSAYTLVSPEEEKDFAAIEKAIGKRLPRHKLEGFDYEGAAVESAANAQERGRREAHAQGGAQRYAESQRQGHGNAEAHRRTTPLREERGELRRLAHGQAAAHGLQKQRGESQSARPQNGPRKSDGAGFSRTNGRGSRGPWRGRRAN
ncbi:MAG TPA: DEAD/DEAH box helicase [bacterium]|nr:DEAD/DEAH box helicase [bacterium]